MKCPSWHKLFYSFRGEQYTRVTANVAGAEPRYTKWTVSHYCYLCRKVVRKNKLATK